MKKIIALFIAFVIPVTFLFSSCKGNKENIGVSSVTPFYEAESQISKNENNEFTFAFDPYVISDEAAVSLNSLEQYKKIVNAILNHNNTVSVSSRDEYENLRFALGEMFPFASLVDNYQFNSNDSSIIISYKYDLSAHQQKIDAFKTEVEAIFNECVLNTDDNVIAALSLYKWILENINITSDSQNTQENISSGISKQEETASGISKTENQANQNDILSVCSLKKGNTASVAAFYNFLLKQLGINSKLLNAWDGNEYIVWNMIQFNKKWYHILLCKEQKHTNGEGLKFFGLTDEELSKNISATEIFTGEWKWFTNNIPKAKSKRFNDFREIVSWEILSDRTGIEAFTEEFSRFVWEI